MKGRNHNKKDKVKNQEKRKTGKSKNTKKGLVIAWLLFIESLDASFSLAEAMNGAQDYQIPVVGIIVAFALLLAVLGYYFKENI